MDFLITITLDKVMQLAVFLDKGDPFYNIQLRKYYTVNEFKKYFDFKT